MLRSDTQTVTIGASPKDVLAFVADGKNLPRWAIGFAQSTRQAGEAWIVTTGRGEEVVTRIVVHDGAGTVDFHMTPAPGLEAAAYTRVVPNAEGTEFVFTHFQVPGTPDEVFEQLVHVVGHELVALKARLEVECPR
jgi:hypothetical protein